MFDPAAYSDASPASFYISTPEYADLADACLVVEGRELPVHSQVTPV